MFTLDNFEERLISWSNFRNDIEQAKHPFNMVQDFYAQVNQQSNKINPWNPDEWPDAWQLLEKNRYCAFTVILGMFFSLKYTDRFAKSNYSILIINDQDLGYITYLLTIDNIILSVDKIQNSLNENQVVLRRYEGDALNK